MDQGGWDAGRASRSQRRIRVTKTKVTKRDRTDTPEGDVLPLDPRDQDVLRAKGVK